MIDIHKLLSADYLINIDLAALHRSDKAFLVVGGALTIAGIIFRLTSMSSHHPYARRIWRRLSLWALTIGLLEVLWFALRYERAVYLGSHLVALLILLVGLVWLVPLLKYWLGQYRHDVSQWQKDQVKQKYIKMQ
jgi:hypothetical protein